MTSPRALPAAVVERCDRAKMKAFIWDGARHEQLTAAALAEFLRILAERGLRVVPMKATDEITLALYGFPLTDEVRWEEADLLKTYVKVLEASPPIAELLEDRDDE